MTLVCVPIMVDDPAAALADAQSARDAGADIVELRIDSYFPGSEGDSEDRLRVVTLRSLIADCPLPVILTCRSAEEGGDYDGDEADRVSLLEKLCVDTDHPPAYLDFELAAYQRSANIRQKINLCVDHPKQQRDVHTRLILSMHDFDQRPSDLMRRLADAWTEPAASVVKFAYRCRSIRDNLEIFEILRDAPKPTIGLGMGEFGLMSRVLAPKFGGFLTFASLRDSAATAPGQPTLSDLLGMYRIRAIGKDTKVYGVIGWPVTQSMSPLIHNAGFEARGWDGVYLPMPVPDSDEAFKATVLSLIDDDTLGFSGASVTIPHKIRLAGFDTLQEASSPDHGYSEAPLADEVRETGAANTVLVSRGDPEIEDGMFGRFNTDTNAVRNSIGSIIDWDAFLSAKVCVYGTGGVARAAIASYLRTYALETEIRYRTREAAERLRDELTRESDSLRDRVTLVPISNPPGEPAQVYINCTPVGMTGGPDPEGLSIPVHDLAGTLPPETVFFDTVYNPIETPMLKAAREHGFRTIDGVEMFVRQAAAQFELWTGEQAPTQLFDRLVRERLGD